MPTPWEPAAGLEPATSAVRERRTTSRAALASEPAAESRTRCVRLTRPARHRGSPAWCPRRDSNAHCRPPHDRASCQLGYEGIELGAEDSNLH